MSKITTIKPSLKLSKLKRVAAYARVSRNKESLVHSFNAQVDYYETYIKANKDYIYKGVYADLGISGTKDSREQFNKLLEECRKGEIDLILTKSISRFARNTATLLRTVRELKALKVDVYFEEQQIHTLSEEGEFILTLLASMAQEEARDMSENVKWAVLKHFSEGKVYSMTILGYRLQNGVLVIEPKEAEAVRLIFKLYLEGYGTQKIAITLNKMGFKSRFNRNLTYTSVMGVLRNETYTGDITLQSTFNENFITKKMIKNKGQKKMWRVEEAHEAIVDKETFNKVQELIRKRAVGVITREESNPFQQKLVCPYCNRHFSRKLSRGKFHYICSYYDKYGKDGCPNKKVPQNILEKATAEVLKLKEFNARVFEKEIDHITAFNDSRLIFYFKDGHEVEKTWSYPSRKELWSEEMKEAARRRTAEMNERRKVCQESQ
ncbi:MAG: Transposon gamma-delta resolvase [Tenericutes bacterium ADurb.Bin024]|nr:MAG: Transposon gamma-delta resolvase [Tenericutes bacterium ADurb.Bin024]